MRPINTEDLQHRELQSSTGEKYSLSAVMTEAFDFKDLAIYEPIK